MENAQLQEDVSVRERKVDLNAMQPEAVEDLSNRIGSKVGGILKESIDKIKRMLAIYNLDLKLVYVIHEIGKEPLSAESDELATPQLGNSDLSVGAPTPLEVSEIPPETKKRGRKSKSEAGSSKNKKRAKTSDKISVEEN